MNASGSAPRPAGPPRVSVVIPTLNEKPNIPLVLARLPESIFELIVVDGRSTDGTPQEVRRLRPDARLLTQPGTGKGDALCAGFAAARGEIVVMLDADGSTDPAEIPAFVAALADGADVAKGSRFIPGGGSSDITPVRSLGNWILSRLVNLLYRTKYSDLCYGYNAFWADRLSLLDIACEGFEVEALINVQIAKAKLRVVEVPSHESPRVHGESNLRPIHDGLRILGIILSQRLIRQTQARQDAGAAFSPQGTILAGESIITVPRLPRRQHREMRHGPADNEGDNVGLDGDTVRSEALAAVSRSGDDVTVGHGQ